MYHHLVDMGVAQIKNAAQHVAIALAHTAFSMVQVDGAAVTTVEGLADDDGRLSRLQQAFSDHHGLQCGFCTPGILMTLTEFLADHPAPAEDQLREALSGNICRCGCYNRIKDAVMAVSQSPAQFVDAMAPKAKAEGVEA